MPNFTNFCVTINPVVTSATVGQNYNVSGSTIGVTTGLVGTLLNQGSGSSVNLGTSRFTGTFPGMWGLTLFTTELGSTAGTNFRLTVTDNASPINCLATQTFTLNASTGTGTGTGTGMVIAAGTPTAQGRAGGTGSAGGTATSRAPQKAKAPSKKPSPAKKTRK